MEALVDSSSARSSTTKTVGDHETSDEDSNCVKITAAKETMAKKVAEQKYLNAYHQRFSCLVASRKGAVFIICTVCKSDFLYT